MTPERPSARAEAVDPDIDLHGASQRREWGAHRWVLPTIALGGMLGASARYGLALVWPPRTDAFDYATFVANVSGCLFIGVVMVFVVEAGGARPLLRPFLGVGVMGGFTTFSTYAVQSSALTREGLPVLAAVYLVGTVVAALAAVVAGVAGARALLRLRRAMSRRRKERS